MVEKSVPHLIYDKFAESISKDVLFNDISDDLLKQVRAKKKSEKEISSLLSKDKNESPGT